MSAFSVITENDESPWEDTTGVSYHFPKRYLKHLQPGTHVIYYKGRIKDYAYRQKRLSDEPHYFGLACIGRIYKDSKSLKGDHFAEIREYRKFDKAVLAKQQGAYLEFIPESRTANYWRDGVRPITQNIYDAIRSRVTVLDSSGAISNLVLDHLLGLPELAMSGVEGKPSLKFVTTYERDPSLREAAIALHGTTCLACGFNFAETYGQHGAGYIQVHHVEPLASEPGERTVNVQTDLIPLCANCHVMVHRYRATTLELVQLKSLIEMNRK